MVIYDLEGLRDGVLGDLGWRGLHAESRGELLAGHPYCQA